MASVMVWAVCWNSILDTIESSTGRVLRFALRVLLNSFQSMSLKFRDGRLSALGV